MKSHLSYLFLGMLVTGLAVPPLALAAPDKPGASQADKNGADELHKAVIALQKQYEAFEAGTSTPIEAEPDYFKKNPAPDVTQLMIVKALNVTYGSDPSTDAYVKLQLFSAVQGKFHEDVQSQAAAVYEHLVGGTLFTNPGFDHRAMDIAATRLNSNNGDALAAQMNDQMDAAVAKFTKLNNPIIRYRDRLFLSLSPTQEVCSAALQDVASRMEHGVHPNEIGGFYNDVKAAIVEWGSDAKSPQLQVMSNTLKKLSILVKSPALVPYAKIAKDTTRGGYHWGTAPVMGPNDFTDLAAVLDKNITNPPKELGFRTEDK